MMSAYKIVHAMGKTQLGGVRGDWLRDLYQAEDAEALAEAEDEDEVSIVILVL
jgi:hypothetical protein